MTNTDIDASKLFLEAEKTQFVKAVQYDEDYIDFEIDYEGTGNRVFCELTIDVERKSHFGLIKVSETAESDFDEDVDPTPEQLAVMVASLPDALKPEIKNGQIDYDGWIAKAQSVLDTKTAPSM